MTLEAVNVLVHARQCCVFVYRVFISHGMPRLFLVFSARDV